MVKEIMIEIIEDRKCEIEKIKYNSPLNEYYEKCIKYDRLLNQIIKFIKTDIKNQNT